MLDYTDDKIDRISYMNRKTPPEKIQMPDFCKSILKAFRNYCVCYLNEAEPIDITIVGDKFNMFTISGRHFADWKRKFFISGMTGLQNLVYFRAQFGLRTPGCPFPPVFLATGPAPAPGGAPLAGSGGGGGGGYAMSPAEKFRNSVKITLHDYKEFKDIQDYDLIRCNYEAKANFQGTQDVLDAAYGPATVA